MIDFTDKTYAAILAAGQVQQVPVLGEVTLSEA